jgi:hypothetical protein
MRTLVAASLVMAGHRHSTRALAIRYGLFAAHGYLLSFALPRRIRNILENDA